jgi:hypothetical protein
MWMIEFSIRLESLIKKKIQLPQKPFTFWIANVPLGTQRITTYIDVKLYLAQFWHQNCGHGNWSGIPAPAPSQIKWAFH